MKSKMKLQTSKNPDHELGGDFYAGGQSEVAKEAKNKAEGFKRGGKTKHHAGRKPRKSGGGVFSSAQSGSPRAKSSHY